MKRLFLSRSDRGADDSERVEFWDGYVPEPECVITMPAEDSEFLPLMLHIAERSELGKQTGDRGCPNPAH